MVFPILWACMARRSAPMLLHAAAILVFTFVFAGSAFAQFTITLQPNTLPAGTNGAAYNQVVTAVGGTAPYTFDLRAGSNPLPTGLILDSDGTLHGTPTTPGSTTFQIEATDNGGNTGFRTYTFSVGSAGGVTITPASLPNGSQGVAYSQALGTTGGTGSGRVFSISSGSLPAGLTMSSAGVISGTPTGNGAFSFTVSVIDDGGNTGSRAYTLNIGAAILTVNPATLPNATLSTPYNQTVIASGGTGPYTFSISSGALPTGLSLASNGNITGTPSAAGAYTFTVRAIDSVNNTGTRTYTVNVGANILTVNPTTLPNGTRTVAYNQTITASGGTGPYTFAVTSGSLPTGLSLASNGTLSGTPSAAGTFNFDIQATDSLANTGTRSYSVQIVPAPLTIAPTSLPNGTTGTAYSQTVTASGGSAPYSYAVISGSLPTGLTLNAGTGAITGTPTVTGSFTFTVQATDAQPNTGQRSYTVQIGANILTIAPTTLPNGTRNVPYSQTVTASGGTGPYTYAVTSGALPAGLSLNASTGAITGTPTGTGASAFTITATDSLANIGSRAYAVNIGTVSLTVNPATLPAPINGRPYSQTVTATGGTGPYTFTISAGALPAGLTLNATTGVISGTTTALTTASFTVQATDANGNIGSRAYTMTSRPDPALDAEVRGIVSAQVAATQRFAAAQTENVGQHLANLHREFNPCSFNFGVAPPIERPQYGNQIYTPQPYGAQPYGSQPYGNYGALSYAGGPVSKDPWAPPPQGFPYTPPPPKPDTTCPLQSFAFWSAGSFQFGSANAAGTGTNNKFNTAGVTAGVDYRLNQGIIIGAALGYGADRSDIGGNGSRSDATSFSGTFYASLRPFDPLFFDFAVGYGGLSFDSRRFVTGEALTVSGTRKGSYWFGMGIASLELGWERFKFAPFVKGEFTSATLDAYTESGATAQLLTYNKMKAEFSAVGLGLRGSIDVPVSFGTLTPNAKVEYKEITQNEYNQSLYYADLGPSVSSSFGIPVNVRRTITTTLGLRARSFGGLCVDIEYGFATGNDSYKAQSVRAALRIPF